MPHLGTLQHDHLCSRLAMATTIAARDDIYGDIAIPIPARIERYGQNCSSLTYVSCMVNSQLEIQTDGVHSVILTVRGFEISRTQNVGMLLARKTRLLMPIPGLYN